MNRRTLKRGRRDHACTTRRFVRVFPSGFPKHWHARIRDSICAANGLKLALT